MKEIFHAIYLIVLLMLMTFWFAMGNTCGVCFVGFLLINARLNEMEWNNEHD